MPFLSPKSKYVLGALAFTDVAYAPFEKTKVLLKSLVTTPIGKGFRYLNVTFRGKYDLYANIRPVKSNSAVKTRFEMWLWAAVTRCVFSGSRPGES